MALSKTICPITGQPAINSTVTDVFFEYSIEYNKNKITLRLAINVDWESDKIVKPEEKLMLRGLLFNNELPLENETIITPGLIHQLMRFGEFPRSFEEKIDYYILSCYLNGGRTYKQIEYGFSKSLRLFTEDREEYNSLMKALQRKGLVTLIESSRITKSTQNKKLELTEEGIKFGKRLVEVKASIEPKRFDIERPKVMVVADVKDSFYSKILTDYLMDFGCTVQTNTNLDSDSNTSVLNAKSSLYSNETDYIVFIKSDSSDRNNNYGSILEVAIEAHENTIKRNNRYVIFAFVDDSDIDSRPRITNYNSDSLDFRIITWRKHLIKLIEEDWSIRTSNKKKKSRNTKRYNFPKIELKAGEEYWLRLIYANFVGGNEEYFEKFISQHWNNLPKNFNPLAISPLLLGGGSNITFYGIWMVDPDSIFVKGLEDLIFAVKEILKEKGKPDEITEIDLKEKLDYSNVDLAKIIILFTRFDGLSAGSGSNSDGTEIKIRIRGTDQLNLYENFTSLEKLFEDTYWKKHFKTEEPDIKKQNPIEEVEKGKKVLNSIIDLENVHSYKSIISHRDVNNVDPVMGVVELAEDLAGIIENLSQEREKGQMIGIFGKWGRGKTFLLNEIWKVLKASKRIKYTRLDFQAWKYQETPASWAYLYEIFVKDYLGEKSVKYYWKLLKLNFKRNTFWPLIKLIASVLVFATGAFLIPGLIATYPKLNNLFSYFLAYSVLGISILAIIGRIHEEFNVKATELIKKYSLKHTFKSTLGIQADIQDELITLLQVWISDKQIEKEKIILFVEDIDRCTEDKIISNIDALRVLLEDKKISDRVIIITAVDEIILKNAIKIKYKSILNFSKDSFDLIKVNELISEYLDKLFISAIKLGGLTEEQRDEFLNAFLKQEIGNEKINEFKNNKRKQKLKDNIKEWSDSDELANNLTDDPAYVEIMGGFKTQEEIVKQFGETKLDLAIENGDFVEKDGDFALENSKGEKTSMVEMETLLHARISKQNQIEKLSEVELELLMNLTKKWSGATPRRIRIYYYRYLLCKNLIISKYTFIKRINVWQNKEGIQTLMNLLLEFTKSCDPDVIAIEKKEILDLNDEMIDKFDFQLYRVDYLYLLEALELIIAY